MSRIFATFCLLFASVIAPTVTASAATSADDNGGGWSHFAWGAEVGGAIDLTSNNLSSINLDAYFGYRNAWINTLGVGASVNMMVDNSVRSFPIYAIFRTDFSSKERLLFMDLRGGVSITNPSYGSQQTGLYLSPGLGINLARGKSFSSYLSVSYVYNGIKPFDLGDRRCDVDGLSMACVRIGISF